MASNKPIGDNARVGAVKKRKQYFNPKTEQWVKVNTENNLFMDVKQDGTPFKGISKPKKIIFKQK